MLSLTIDEQKCTRCGLCSKDCPAAVISMDRGYPAIASEQEAGCIKCQHCLAICPTGALSILGKTPLNSLPLTGNLPDPQKLETLIKGRRSVRQYRNENLDPELLQHLLEVAWHAPTGVNSRQVHFTVVDDRAVMDKVREETMHALSKVVAEGALPPRQGNVCRFCELLERK
jgi:Fe-S-cluster-containing hydrogenase component 2